MIDKNKRKSLRALGVAGVGTAAALSTPGVLAGAKNIFDSGADASNAPFSGMTVKHYSNFEGHTLLFQNETSSPIALQGFQDAEVNTPTGRFNLNAVMKDQAFVVPANATQAVSLGSDGTVHRYALWTSTSEPESTMALIDRTQKVKVIGQYRELRTPDSQIYLANVQLT
ncbi:MAG: hypothetical protein KTR18_09330 [Acidiferrobacterales bacterium]|nr:hypothetical protein [Acidiferrobacterales bacterium]